MSILFLTILTHENYDNQQNYCIVNGIIPVS
jgi:hypothetical protein